MVKFMADVAEEPFVDADEAEGCVHHTFEHVEDELQGVLPLAFSLSVVSPTHCLLCSH